MKTTSTLILGFTVAIAAMPALALGNSQVWTTTHGAAIVDSSGNPVRTIHYQRKSPSSATNQPKATPALMEIIQQTVVKVFNQQPEVALIEPQKVAVQKNLGETPKAIVAKQPVVEPVPSIPEYQFNHYKATVLFNTDSAALSHDASASLTQLAMATGIAESVIAVHVVGHADSRGEQGYNMTLSERRVQSVVNFLKDLKVKVTATFAKGETIPVIGDNGEDFVKSRRVHVSIKTRHLKN
ncbi:MAG: OmpA family protein [Gammaproteobacteria bacterium]|nr:OmpA family protein [Gammaproteobacteria bacterium]